MGTLLGGASYRVVKRHGLTEADAAAERVAVLPAPVLGRALVRHPLLVEPPQRHDELALGDADGGPAAARLAALQHRSVGQRGAVEGSVYGREGGGA